MLQDKYINDYLYYGYLFPEEISEKLMNLPDSDQKSGSYTVKDAANLFDRIFEKTLENFSSDKFCVIPISGGWDSRLLLGAAVEHLKTSQIKTYSFGAPGQLDFEIGRKVAKSLEVEHLSIDIRKIEMDWDQLEETAKEAPWTKVFDAFINRYCVKLVANDDDVVLSGFMGDPLFGSHIVNDLNNRECKKLFVKRQDITEGVGLFEGDYNPEESIPDLPKDVFFDTYDILDFGIRQANMVAPIVTPLREMKEWNFSLGSFGNSNANIFTPFTHPEWVMYWALAPKDLRKDRNLFFRMFQYKFPELHKIPAKEYFGAVKNQGFNRNLRRNLIRVQNRLHKHLPRYFKQSNKMHNYHDFDEAFRNRSDYQEILKKAIHILKENSVAEWIDFDKMWDDHMSFKNDHAKSFRVLIGLALNLKVKNPVK